ncbi:MAG: hypothetical protein AB8E82_17085 [Aureispira sp.]
MSENKEKSLGSIIGKFYLLIPAFFIIVPTYAILGAILLPNHVLYTLVALLLAYWAVSLVIYAVYVVDTIVKWLRSGFRDYGADRDEEDYSPSLSAKIFVILLIANGLMLLLRSIFSADSAIHEFSYFPIRVLALQGVATVIAYQFNRFTENIF